MGMANFSNLAFVQATPVGSAFTITIGKPAVLKPATKSAALSSTILIGCTVSFAIPF